MIEKARTDRPGEMALSSRAVWRMLTRRRRAYLLFTETVLILAAVLGGYMAGRELGRRNVTALEETIQQLRSERLELSATLNKRNEGMSALQIKLDNVQAALDAIVPSENTYNVYPNQSLIVAQGRLTVGLIGQPTNQTVTMNINGKQQSVAAGDVITLASGETTTCQIAVQSFDMFKVILNATCSAKTR